MALYVHFCSRVAGPSGSDPPMHKIRFPAVQVPLAAAALQFPLGLETVRAVVPGAISAAEAERNAATMDAELPPDLWRAFKEEGCLPGHAPVPGGDQ